MKKGVYQIEELVPVAKDMYRLTLVGEKSGFIRPGQFMNIELPGFFLRRPLSISVWDDKRLTVYFKVVGRGTDLLSKLPIGKELNVLTGLGNGYTVEKAEGKQIVLVGGGSGTPPLVGLAKELLARGEALTVVLGFDSAASVFCQECFTDLGIDLRIATVDGTRGTKGFVTDVLRDLDYDYYFACGPIPMLKAIHQLGKEGQLSFEARMGCGFGACMSCSMRTASGSKRVCLEGPVMRSQEVFFD